MAKIFKVGLIGCGHIAETYFKAHKYFNNFRIIKCADINAEAAKKCASKYNIETLSVKNLLKDDEIEIILNLTIPKAHFEIAKKALLHNKHVYTEKPLAINLKDGKELLKLSRKKKLYIVNAPDTFLGGGSQKTRELLDKNIIGKINFGNAIFAFPGIQSYHPNPESWFAKKEGGPVIDMGPYFFTTLVNLLGPVKNIRGRGAKFSDKREYKAGPKKGETFNVEIPTSYMFNIEFQNKAIIQGFISFDVLNHKRNHMELYGTKGSLVVPDPNMFGGPVSISGEFGSEWKDISVEDKPLGKTNIINHSGRSNEAPEQANYRGIGLAEMIDAIENNRMHRCNGELALHVLDVIECAMISSIYKVEVELRSSCVKPEPMHDDFIRQILKKL